jgi:hypothetical protein
VGNVEEDFYLGLDLMRGSKEHNEFCIVRDWVHAAMSRVCCDVQLDTAKALLKLRSVQHLYGKLSGRLQRGHNDADLLVCLCFPYLSFASPCGMQHTLLVAVSPCTPQGICLRSRHFIPSFNPPDSSPRPSAKGRQGFALYPRHAFPQFVLPFQPLCTHQLV